MTYFETREDFPTRDDFLRDLLKRIKMKASADETTRSVLHEIRELANEGLRVLGDERT